MRRYRTIVVYINGTAADERAVATAAGIAAASDGQLILLCPYEKVVTPDAAPTADILKNEAFLLHGSFAIDNALHAARTRAAACGPRRVSARVEPGLPRKVVPAVADEVGADLVVIGGRSGWTQRPFGGLAGSIVRRSSVDVVVAYPEAARAQRVSRQASPVPAVAGAAPGQWLWLRRAVASGVPMGVLPGASVAAACGR